MNMYFFLKLDDDSNDACISEEEAIEGNLKKISLEATDKSKFDPITFLKLKEENIRRILKEELAKRRRIKFYLTLQVRFTKTRGDQVETAEPFFHGRCHIVLKKEDIETALRESIMKIVNSFLEYQREGSNWTLDKVLGVNIHIIQYDPIKGSSYLPLPSKLANKKAIINIQNSDQKCFMWSVIASLYPVAKDPQRVIKYVQYVDKLDFTDVPFPVKIGDIPKFEKKNQISINVFGFEKQEIFPLHLTKERGLRHVDLLVINKGTRNHYCLIKDFDRLLNDGQKGNQLFHCHYCLHGFTKKRLLQNHVIYCQVHGAQRTEMPTEEDKWLKFTDISKQLKVPFVVYADFESILERHYGCQPDPNKSSTIKLAKHVPSGFTYKVVGVSPETTENHVTYRGEDAVEKFMDHMVKLEEKLVSIYY